MIVYNFLSTSIGSRKNDTNLSRVVVLYDYSIQKFPR